MTNQTTGRFYVLNERLVGGRGYTVRDHLGVVIYRLRAKSEANAACSRLNIADRAA